MKGTRNPRGVNCLNWQTEDYIVGLLIQFQWVGSLQVTLVKKDFLPQPPNICHPPPAFFQSKITIEFVQPIFLSPEEERVFVSLSYVLQIDSRYFSLHDAVTQIPLFGTSSRCDIFFTSTDCQLSCFYSIWQQCYYILILGFLPMSLPTTYGYVHNIH